LTLTQKKSRKETLIKEKNRPDKKKWDSAIMGRMYRLWNQKIGVGENKHFQISPESF